MVRVIGYRRFGGVQVFEEEECTLPQPGKGQVGFCRGCERRRPRGQ